MATRQKSTDAPFGKNGFDMVMVAHRNPAAGQQQVRAGAGIKCFPQSLGRVPRMKPMRDHAACFGHLGGQRVSIGIVNLTGLEWLPWFTTNSSPVLTMATRGRG